jgi:protein SCO1/2
MSTSRTGSPRRAARLFVGLAMMTGLLAGCGKEEAWHSTNLKGAMPPLAFTMTRASDSKEVTAADFKGKVVLLYFGYTFCPDVCPTTLANIDKILTRMGDKADQVRVLFVTVDPNRDTLDVLKSYTELFAPEIVGLRGTPDQLAALARRYRVSYSVTPATKDEPYDVAHSSAVYVFDKSGAIRLLMSSLSSPKPDIDGGTADLERLAG